MATTTKRLRNCTAHVITSDNGFCTSHELVSYNTPVALYGMMDGEFADDNGELHECHGMALLLSEYYDCSVTTMSHVRKFIEDYIGIRATIADIREALNSDNILECLYRGDMHMYDIYVYRASWA